MSDRLKVPKIWRFPKLGGNITTNLESRLVSDKHYCRPHGVVEKQLEEIYFSRGAQTVNDSELDLDENGVCLSSPCCHTDTCN